MQSKIKVTPTQVELKLKLDSDNIRDILAGAFALKVSAPLRATIKS